MSKLLSLSLLCFGTMLGPFAREANAGTPLSGNYTINKNAASSATNFISFTAAAQELAASGVGGAVTITVVPGTGPYNEQLILPAITGTSATNTVIFEGSGNTLASNNTTTNPGVITFNGADYVKVNNLKIDLDPAATAGAAVSFANASDNDVLSNCTVTVSIAAAWLNQNAIQVGTSGGNNANNLLLQNNIVNGGYNGINLTGTGAATGNRVLGNQVRDSRAIGIYVYNCSGTIIEGNDISRPQRVNTQGFKGISLDGSTVSTLVNRNRIHNTHDLATNPLSFSYGIYTSASAPVGSENIIQNNLIYNSTNNGGPFTGLQNEGANGTWYFHNTVSANNPAITYTTLRGIYFSAGSSNVKFINNLLSLPASASNKHAMYLSATTIGLISNGNDLYLGNSGNTGYFNGADSPSLASWKGVNGGIYDQNSIAADPVFVNPANYLQPTASALNNTGQPLSAVTDDINGNTRSTTTPDMGAYEFTPAVNDAGVTAIVSPTSPATPGVSTPVTVNLKNFGTAALTSATIGWSVNGAAQPNYTWSGNLASQQTTTSPVAIGNYTFPVGNVTLKVWSKLPNGATDGLAANDTTILNLVACAPLSGNYTINKNNPTGGTNFQTFAEVTNRLNSCGVSGPVTLTVAPNTGPYNEQVEIRTIPYTSATNTVTFEGSGNTVSVTPGVRYGIFTLNGADYVKINNFTIALPATATTGWGVQLINAADHNIISNNTINLPLVTSTANINGIIAGASIETKGNNTNFTLIQNNTINGGGCGIQINGNTEGLDALNNQITGNTIKDSNSYGILINCTTGTLIEGNDISRPARTSSGTYSGIYLYNSTCLRTTISKNRIHNTHDVSTTPTTMVYGIQNNATATVGNENIIKNNLVYNLNNAGGSVYALYNGGGSGSYYYHNTVTTMPGINYNQFNGMYFSAPSANVQFRNNIISLPGTATTKYALYVGNTAISLISNNNNLFAGASGNVGYQAGPQPTLAFWQTTGRDLNSVSVDPVFVNTTTGNLQPSAVGTDNIGQPIAAVPDDILGVTRNTVTPDPGAYEFGVASNDVGLTAVTGPSTNGCSLSATEAVTVSIKNFGNTIQTSIPLTYSLNGVAIAAPETWTGTLAPNATTTYTFNTKANLSNPGTYRIIARTQLPGDLVPANDPDTMDVTNTLVQISALPFAFDFETPATGLSRFLKVTNSHSAITEAAGASNGTGSTKGMILDGVDNPNWLTPAGVTDPWTNNPNNFAAAYICLSPAAIATPDSLWLTFDLKQLYKTANVNTNFRVTVNGTQAGPSYKPPFSGTGGTANWTKVKVDLTPYKNDPTVRIGFESSVKEAYANGTGTANLIDNINIQRRVAQTGTGLKENALAANLNVFPNPSNGNFNVSLENGMAFSLKVTDLSGKIILEQKAKGNTKLKLEGAAKGVYLLHVSSENGTAVRKLIVE